MNPDKLCATRNAELVFHAGNSTLARDVQYWGYSKKLRAYLDSQGGLMQREITVSWPKIEEL